MWALIWGAVNSRFLKLVTNELILCSRGNSWSSFPGAVLVRASFIIVFDGFRDCTWEYRQSSWNFQIGWPSCLKVMMDCCFSLLSWVVLAIIWINTLVVIGLFTVYKPYLCTTQLMVPNTLTRQEIPQIKGTPVNWKPFQVTASWIW